MKVIRQENDNKNKRRISSFTQFYIPGILLYIIYTHLDILSIIIYELE